METKKAASFIAISIAGLLLLYLGIIAVINIVRGPFYVAFSYPAAGQSITLDFYTKFTVTFSRSIKPITTAQISFTPANTFRVSTNEKTVTITPIKGFLIGKYTLQIKNVVSTDDYTMATYSIPFTVAKDDGFANSQVSSTLYPITGYLPHYDVSGWTIRMPDPQGNFLAPPDGYAMPFFVYVDTILTDSQLRQPTNEQQSLLETMRQQAMAYIKNKGINTDDYAYHYTDPYLQQKYGTTQPHVPPIAKP